MQKSLANVVLNGIPSLVLTSSTDTGVVVITDKKRTGAPESIEKGALFTVYPFGKECGVMISHAAINRKAVQCAGAPTLEAQTECLADEEFLLRAAQHYLVQARVTCAEFDPDLTEGGGAQQLNGDGDDGAARLAGAREFNRIAGERLYQEMISAETRHKERVSATARRKTTTATSQRLNRERKLARAIAGFRRMPGGPSYHNYLRLQVRGTGDMFAMMDDATILRRSGPLHVLEVRRWLTEPSSITEALRWILRGLSPNMAIRKVIADIQERTLATTFVNLPRPTTATFAYVRVR